MVWSDLMFKSLSYVGRQCWLLSSHLLPGAQSVQIHSIIAHQKLIIISSSLFTVLKNLQLGFLSVFDTDDELWLPSLLFR